MSSIDDEALHWVMRQASGTMNAAESAEFDTWFAAHPRHQGAYLRASAIQHSFDQLKVEDSLKPSTAPRLHESENLYQAPARSRRAVMFGGALAAGLAAIAFVALRPVSVERTVLSTAQGEFRKVPLADRSVVSMNSGTELEVIYDSAERRIVLTQGEAWFEVAKDKSKPFIVESDGVRVRAVGTAFAVRRYPGGADVLVTEGTVDVWNNLNPAQKRRLQAGALAYIPRAASDIKISRDPDDIERKLAWRNGQLIFQNRMLADAVADFNRYNLRQIVIADPRLGSRTLVGQYRLDQPEQFAADVRALFGAPVVLEASRITIGKSVAGQSRTSR